MGQNCINRLPRQAGAGSWSDGLKCTLVSVGTSVILRIHHIMQGERRNVRITRLGSQEEDTVLDLRKSYHSRSDLAVRWQMLLVSRLRGNRGGKARIIPEGI